MKLVPAFLLLAPIGAGAFSPALHLHPHRPAVGIDIGRRPGRCTASAAAGCVAPPPLLVQDAGAARLRAGTAAASASSSSERLPSPASDLIPVASTLLFVLADVRLRRYFASRSIAFPSSLAGCGALFAALLALDLINEEWAGGLYGALEPGAAVLAKWLPLFFVPSLVTLPLARSVGSGAELAKIVAVVVGGFFFTLLTTAWSVMGARALFADGPSITTTEYKKHGGPIIKESPPPAFSKTTFESLTALAVGFGGAAALAVKSGAADTAVTPLKTASMLFATLSTFVFGARLPAKFTRLVHPLVTCTGLTWASARLLGAVTGGVSLLAMLGQYKAGTLCPVHCGAGDLLLFMLGPAVVSLACQMYGRRKLMAQNVGEVGTAVAVSSVGGLFGTALMVRLLKIADPVLRLCMLSRNITSPLAMAIAAMVGADVSLAVSTVVITGLIGANFGASILDSFGIRDAVARGLGIGAAAHGLGTAAFKDEKDAFPFAAIAMALTACTCTVLVSISSVKAALLKLALG